MATGSDADRAGGRLREALSENGLQFALVAPTVLWFVAFLLVPLAVVLYFSFLTVENFQVVRDVTLATWTTDVFTPTNLRIFATTFGFGAAVTLLSLLFGYPVAYFLRFYVRPNVAFLVVLVFIIPFWISGIIRTLSWYPLLGRQGVLNQLLVWSGVVGAPLDWLLFSSFAMLVGYLQNYVVFMFVPIYVALLNVDEDLLDASETLRGRPWQTFRNVTWPLSLSGVAIGAIFVFVLSIGDFVVPQFLSGGRTTIPGLVFLEINQGLNYPAASALSIVLLIVILAIVALLTRLVDITETF
jgi:putative spermidine/putrescine transport system permease protein